MTCQQGCNKSNTTDATCEPGTTLPAHLSSLPGFRGARVARYLVFCVMFLDRRMSVCRFLFDHCVVCPSNYPFGILDLRLLTTPLVSSDFYFYIVF